VRWVVRSGDGTARIWKVPSGDTGFMTDENGKALYDEPGVLKHFGKSSESKKVSQQTSGLDE
jgi:hypothetical protein